MPEKLLVFNGINGATGDYGLPPMTGTELANFIKGESTPANLKELRHRYEQDSARHLGVRAGVDPSKLEEAGWGVIFAHDADPAVKEALNDLLKLRQSQAGQYFRVYEGPAKKGGGHRPGESKSKFLARNDVGPGPANPKKVPYYLLIVGSPERIPFDFQYQLDVQYAVGRIHFDTLQEYANYAASVVQAETNGIKLARDVRFFGVANPDDDASNSTTNLLIEPIYKKTKKTWKEWNVEATLRDDAVRSELARMLGGDQTPALLVSGSHGMEFPVGDKRQLPHQGALLCRDWPGPKVWEKGKSIPEEHYFAGDHLASDANLLGMLAFFFACYGGGTPLNDEFSEQAFTERMAIAPHPFVAGLPTRMLGLSRGGALAVIGHVERAWTYSFDWPDAGEQTTTFVSTLHRLLKGHPVGSAIDYFNGRWAELATVLSDELKEIKFGKEVDPYALANMWTANNDARSYVIIGDPAVRMPVAKPGDTPAERPVLEVSTSNSAAGGPSTEEHAATVELAPAGHASSTRPQSLGLPTLPAQVADADGKTALPALDLENLSEELKTVVVTTYGAKTVEGDSPQVVAKTVLLLDGDVQTTVAENMMVGAEHTARLHSQMVEQAIKARLAWLELVARAAPKR